MMRGLANAWRRFGAANQGVAAIEFALVVPIVMVVYLVGFEVAEAATVYRKLTDTTVQLANTTAQYTSMGTTDTSNVLNASAQIMSPYPSTNLTIVLSQVKTNSSGVGAVCWSQTLNGTALASNASVTMPAGFQTANTDYILVQTTYTYNPVIGGGLMGNIAMTDQIFMLPRATTSIPFTNSGGTTTTC